jgi:hypothetical protein
MKFTEIEPYEELVDNTPDLDDIIEFEIRFYGPGLDLHTGVEFLPEQDIIKDDYRQRELNDRELERQRKEYFDSINSPGLPSFNAK